MGRFIKAPARYSTISFGTRPLAPFRQQVPDVYWNMTAQRVVTMEFVPGVKINNLEEIDRRGIDRKLLAKRSAEAYLTQLCRHGFFHCDPHPGTAHGLNSRTPAAVRLLGTGYPVYGVGVSVCVCVCCGPILVDSPEFGIAHTEPSLAAVRTGVWC